VSRYGPAPLLERLQLLADHVQNAASLVDTPTNELGTTAFATAAEAAAKATAGVEFFMLSGEELKEAGLGGLYGVGKAASEPPRLVVLRYAGRGAGSESVCWVGKGIVYDTGGLSIKSKDGMPGMKRDMGGAAAVMEAFFAAATARAAVNLTAVLCLAENAVGPDATRPDDVRAAPCFLLLLYCCNFRAAHNVRGTPRWGRVVLAVAITVSACVGGCYGGDRTAPRYSIWSSGTDVLSR